ncbi:Mu homology domain-containing protein [Syncephalis fuscata]|nr:Mu homology domain-containing protein [Syncephalis fuscata]
MRVYVAFCRLSLTNCLHINTPSIVYTRTINYIQMFSQVFILNEEGTPLLRKDYRYDTPSDTLFLLTDRLLEKLDTPPVYLIDDLYIVHILYGELYIGGCSLNKPSTTEALETLTRLGQLIVGVCGAPEEALIRKHDTLVYELLDEALTDGYPTRMTLSALSQQLTTNHTKPLLKSPSQQGVMSKLSHFLTEDKHQQAPPATSRSALATTTEQFEDETLYLDIIERIHCIFDEDAKVIRSVVDGVIKTKCFLGGRSLLKIQLSPRLCINNASGQPLNLNKSIDAGVVQLRDCRLHDSVDRSAFEEDQVLSLYAPAGELVIASYQITDDFIAPFQIIPILETSMEDPRRITIRIRIRADFTSERTATQCTMTIPLPRAVTSASSQLDALSELTRNIIFDREQSRLVWRMNNIHGSTERTLTTSALLDQPWKEAFHSELKAIRLDFEIANYTCSTMAVTRLRILNQANSTPPQRWIRYTTTTETYHRRW